MFHDWLRSNEAVWLFYVLASELVVGVGTLVYVIREYYYDYRKDETKSKRIRRTRKSVKVVVEDGQARIAEQPEGIDVVIQQSGESK